MPERICLKGRTKKTLKQDSAWSEDGGKKNEYLTLWEGRFGVMCGARGKGRCVVLSRAVRVMTISPGPNRTTTSP